MAEISWQEVSESIEKADSDHCKELEKMTPETEIMLLKAEEQNLEQELDNYPKDTEDYSLICNRLDMNRSRQLELGY